MPKNPKKYCIIREYENQFNMSELVKRIVRSHIKDDIIVQDDRGCLDHEVNSYGN